MITRDEIKRFLTKNKDKSKEEVISKFTGYCLKEGHKIEQIGRLIMDLRSYNEWKWG